MIHVNELRGCSVEISDPECVEDAVTAVNSEPDVKDKKCEEHIEEVTLCKSTIADTSEDSVHDTADRETSSVQLSCAGNLN